MNRGIAGVFTVLLLATVASPQNSAEIQKRVSPAAYGNAPGHIRERLKREHCDLPQTQHWDETQLNIVSGRFASREQTDWAALCIAQDGGVHVIVFWGKRSPCGDRIDSGWPLQTHLLAGEAGSLYLRAAPRKQILDYRKFFGDSNHNPVTHDGIEVGDDKASLIYYCYGGKWLDLQGSD
jgi:hypothetical protein